MSKEHPVTYHPGLPSTVYESRPDGEFVPKLVVMKRVKMHEIEPCICLGLLDEVNGS
nr:hypothetical protein [uncultured Pseudodesulfovibrio sp.]